MKGVRLPTLARGLLLGAAAPVATGLVLFVSISLAISALYIGAPGPVDPSKTEGTTRAILRSAAFLANGLTFAAAYLAVRSREGNAIATMLATAIGSAAMQIVIVQVNPNEAPPPSGGVVVLAFAAAGLGALVGARTRLEDRALVEATEALRSATSRDEILRAIGAFQGRAGLVRVALFGDGAALAPVAEVRFADSPVDASTPRLELRLPGGGRLEIGVLRRRLVRRRRGALWSAVAAQTSVALQNVELVEEACDTALRRERERVSEELHDTLAQDLVSAVVHLEAATQRLGRDDAHVARHVREALDATRTGLVQARRLVWASRAAARTTGEAQAEGASLDEAVGRLVGAWSKQTGIAAHVASEGVPAKVADEASALVVRAAREALTNVKKHARASEVRVTLSRIGDLVALDVTDDGVGFDPEVRPAAGAGFGLVALRERARALGGELAVESELGKRTTICLHVPSAGKGEP